MEIADLVAAGEAMHEALGREHYLVGAGLKLEPSFQEIYERFDVLQSDEALESARASGSRELLEWVINVRVGRAVAPFEERQVRWEQAATVTVEGQELPYLEVPIRLANTKEREYRAALDRARGRLAAANLNPLRKDRFGLEHDLVRSHGYDDYVAGVSALSGIDLDALGRAAQSFLETSADMYATGLEQLTRRRLGCGPGDLVRADVAWTFRADRFDGAFLPDRLMSTATRQMNELGLDPAQDGRVRFDTEERAGKQPRAFCAPVRVPDEVYLVLRPQGGHTDYRTFWHELGHAMHFASVAKDLSFASRWLGDNSVTEGFAMLWDHLTLLPAWLARYTDLSATARRDLTFELGVNELYMVRRYAAKLSYELIFHRSDLDRVGALYADLLTSATLFRYAESDSLLDVDPWFYAARYLRAWQLEATMADLLTNRFDDDWFRNPAAGAFVHALMNRGQADAADALALQVAGQPLSFEPILRRLEPLMN